MRYIICSALAAALCLGGCAAENNKDSRLGLLLSALESPPKAPIHPGTAPQQGGPAFAARSGSTPIVWYYSPLTGSSISDGAMIVVLFNEAMDPATLVLGGTMASQASVTWYPYQVANQYLLITPNPKWTAGSGRTLTIDADDAQGDTLSTVSLSYTIVADTTPPSVTSVTPADNSGIWDVSTIKFVFDEQLNALKTPVFGGSMAGQVNGWFYSTTSTSGDTLVVDAKTLSVPAGRWTTGAGRTLNVTVEDPAGNSTTTANYTFDVSAIADGIVYVKTTGNDANPGTKLSPLATVGAGLTKVHTLMGTGRVNIAAGMYNESVQMNRENISIYGGYSASDWAVRDTATHVTHINWDTTSGHALYVTGFQETITTATIVDGIKLTGYVGAQVDRASPTISNSNINANSSGITALLVTDYSSANITDNVINAPASTAAGSTGLNISLTGASSTSNVTISGNTVNAGSCAGNCSARGIYGSIGSGVTSANINITDNTVTAGAGKWSYGLAVYSASTNGTYSISDNTVDAGTGTDLSQALVLSGSAGSPTWTITENTLNGGTGNTSYGVSGSQNGTVILRRNRIYGKGNNAAGTFSYGVSLGVTGATITNNIIGGGIGHDVRSVSLGSTTDVKLLNNTIIGGTSSHGNNMVLYINTATGRIENNIMIDTGNRLYGGNFCINPSINSSTAGITLKNNNVDGPCVDFVRDDANGCGGSHICTVAQTNALGSAYGGNVRVDPLFTDADGADNDASTFADNDYTLSGSTPASVYQGALDLSSDFTVDFTGLTRTVSWSMGAYEKN